MAGTSQDVKRPRPQVRVIAGGGPPLQDLSYSGLRDRFAKELRPRKSIYWTDMLGSATVAWGAFAGSLYLLPLHFWASAFLTVVSILAMYRAVLFIHEITHLKRGAIQGFETAWNLAVGVPLLVPSLMYIGSHNDHHRRAVFGTATDPEYEPIGHWSPVRVIASALPMLFVPAALVARWGILGPISYLVPPLRRVVVERLSALVINSKYRRKPPKGPAMLRWAFQEAGTAAYVWALIGAAWAGMLPVSWLVHLYVVAAGLLLVNHVRTLAAHRYIGLGEEMSREGQLLDSVNLVSESLWTKLVAPVGLRYHALHHLVPNLPYHSLGAVHRALIRELPADSAYHRVSVASVREGIRNLMRDARENSRTPSRPGPGRGPTGPTARFRPDVHRAA
ncbi:MAG: fatty acid desaturase [Myxococcales bacterium]|nr:MAG: fatty acid desaturase [Myxococcales bacterium]